ncbi:hypothetical protein BGZ65_010979, partial [Modicella reniformis]
MKQNREYDALDTDDQPTSVPAMENNLQAYSFESVQEYTSALQQFYNVYEGLHSKKFRSTKWECRKAARAELDWAVNGALRMTNKNRP